MCKYLAKINIQMYYMSSQTPPVSIPSVFPGMYPGYASGYPTYSDETILASINNTTRQLTGDINGVSKDLSHATLGLRDSIERGNTVNNSAIERTAAISQNAIERVAAENRASALVADAASRQFAADQFRDVIRTVDANGYTATGATERTAAVTQSAIERNAGETRASALVADAASRQFAADQFRDVIRTVDANGYTATGATERTASQLALSVERNGAANTHATERNATQILGSVERTAGETRLTNVVADAASRQAAADTARDILRAVDSNGYTATSATERTNAQLAMAIERNGATNTHATERNSSQILSNLERTSGEARLTTTVTDAASREAAAMQAQQINSAIDRNGASAVNATQTTYAGLLASIERNAGESRMASVQLDSANQARMADTRRDIIGQVNQTSNAILTSVDKNGADTRSMVAETAWESRSGINNGFAAAMLGQEKIANGIQMQAGQNYASLLLEQQKSNDYLAARGDTQFAANQMELQKAKAELGSKMGDHYSSLLLEQNRTREYLGSKTDNQFAMGQMELQKVKAELATQAAQQFSIGQLEQQKLGSLISAQLAESKYEGLKTQQLLADKIDHNGESIKLRMDNIDRDRLRDNLTVERNDNNVLKILELTELSRRRDYDRGPYYGRDGDHGHHGHHGGR